MSFSPRQSPFKRPESPVSTRTPSTVRAASPQIGSLSPTKGTAPSSSPMLGSDRQSPFVRRPSQLGLNERPKSPFARAPSRLSVAETPDLDSSNSDPFVVKSPPLSSAGASRPTSGFSLRSSPKVETFTSPPLQSINPAPPAFDRTQTSNTAANNRPAAAAGPSFTASIASPSVQAKPTLSAFANTGSYSHIPPPLLRTMRESFEVLDSSSSNTITKNDLAAILTQLGLDASPSSLSSFFPPSGPSSLNLSKFLDMLCEPMKDLSERDELMAAFSAFDVDDSGQIDVGELRDAVLRTAPEGGLGAKMGEREVDSILGEFTARRAFGAKGVSGKDVGGRGEVFRYRDFMASIQGSGMNGEGVHA